MRRTKLPLISRGEKGLHKHEKLHMMYAHLLNKLWLTLSGINRAVPCLAMETHQRDDVNNLAPFCHPPENGNLYFPSNKHKMLSLIKLHISSSRWVFHSKAKESERKMFGISTTPHLESTEFLAKEINLLKSQFSGESLKIWSFLKFSESLQHAQIFHPSSSSLNCPI